MRLNVGGTGELYDDQPAGGAGACRTRDLDLGQLPAFGLRFPPATWSTAGSPFDAPRGYGWNTTLSMWSRERGRNVPQVLDTFIFSSAVRTWEMELANGFYDVWLSVGDACVRPGPATRQRRGCGGGHERVERRRSIPGAAWPTFEVRRWSADGRDRWGRRLYRS